MIALGCDEVLVGGHSELGPIDPQIVVPVPEGSRFAPAHAILRDFERAKEQCKQDVSSIAAWTPILRSYAGGLIEFCNQAIQLSMEVVASWLEKYMLRHSDMNIPENERGTKATQIAEWFGSADSYDRFRHACTAYPLSGASVYRVASPALRRRRRSSGCCPVDSSY